VGNIVYIRRRLDRFDHLLSLARDLETRAPRCGFRRKKRLLQLACIYRDMALSATSKVSDPDARAQAIKERDELREKLRALVAQRAGASTETLPLFEGA
jgi:hypothetical protein